ncbi:GNAT family N-acetyltransferase [Tsukamurella sp. 1534]|uniref:GNAT family N-acetyltransferase n=1 Tax=Tsukamurella sp. 1534 TaxID=1151061 RepID=UPI00031AF3DF|nr:GNAT family N-acetyltransferase [Tsukamurella sp. 1534]
MAAPQAGDRVVVRHLLPDGRATDVVGHLIDGGDPLIVERDGARHVIARDAVVAFKAVPPKPVRASEIRSLDLARARGWWSLEREWVDGWLCRAAPGLTGDRANSAAPLHPDASLDRLDGVRAWYAERRLPVRLSTSDRLLRGAPALARTTDVLTAPSGGTADAGVVLAASPGADWLRLSGAAAALAASAEGTVGFASIVEDGETVATARLAVTADAAGTQWGGVSAVTVAERHRRRGLASRIMAAVSARAAEEGAARLYLEVLQDNPAAHALYAGLGFTRHHSYGYWTDR